MKYSILLAIVAVATVNAANDLVCEHETMSLECKEGEQIRVASAMYGRQRDDVCPGANDGNTECAADSSLDVIKDQCNMKESCEVRASNGVFSDPCRGTFKYLDVKYYCTKNLVCEHETMSLGCEEGEQIRVASAMYGRQRDDVCPGPNDGNTECAADSSLDVIKDQCHMKESCEVRASNGVFSDPCRGTFKYLDVKYYCTKNERVCEHDTLELECPDDQVLKIHSALYGRGRTDVCLGPNDNNDECTGGEATSLKKVRKECEGENSCEVGANNGKFGDPCRGTYKYLQVVYSCNDE